MTRSTLHTLHTTLTSNASIASLACEVLAPLTAYDRERGADLAHTLRVLLECGGNQSRTAEELFLHRSSLLYRLRRIEELTGYNLRDNEECLLLHLCFMALSPEKDAAAPRATLPHPDLPQQVGKGQIQIRTNTGGRTSAE